MADIKVRNRAKKGVKALEKAVVQTEKFKDNIVKTKEKIEESVSSDTNASEYASNKIKIAVNRSTDEVVHRFNKQGKRAVAKTKENYIKSKTKIKKLKKKMQNKKMAKKSAKNAKTAIKTSKDVVKATEKTAKESIKFSQKAYQVAKETAKQTVHVIKVTAKATISAIKAIIAGTKALVSAIIAGGWIAVIVIIVVCLVALLTSSIFGIFFSSEKTSSNAITMNTVVVECNREFADRIQEIQSVNEHDEYVLDGSMASWKDILLVYAIKQSNGKNEIDVVTIDERKKQIIKEIFWEMNSLSSEVKEENVERQDISVDNDVLNEPLIKKVLHIKIANKSVEEMKVKYGFNSEQNKQLAELSSDKYSSLWAGVIYGSNGSGEYVNWRQKDPAWANVRMGNSSGTIGSIGCLVTSIAILIEKSGVNTTIIPFNPGTFVEALNSSGGLDGGNLQYTAVTKLIPNFKYVGNVNLRDKSRQEKLATIFEYFSQGYYLTAEVKGATKGSQHWVAVTGVDSVNVLMIDPASEQTIMWNVYEVSRTTQFNYFKVE